MQGDEASIPGQFFEVSNNEAIQMWNKLSRINVVVIPFSHFFLRVAMKGAVSRFLITLSIRDQFIRITTLWWVKPRIFLKFLSQTGFNQHIFKVKKLQLIYPCETIINFANG